MCLAVPGKIESISGTSQFSRFGKVNFGGVLREVSLTCVPEATIGDFVMVHAGFALSRLDEAEAHKVFALLQRMEAMDEWTEEPDPNFNEQGRGDG